MNEFSEKFRYRGADYNVNYVEKGKLLEMVALIEKQEMTIDKWKEKIRELIDAVNEELAEFDQPKTIWEYLFSNKKQLYLRARLKNYMILYSVLTAPDKLRKQLEEMLKNLKK